jgi:hypothetical protein
MFGGEAFGDFLDAGAGCFTGRHFSYYPLLNANFTPSATSSPPQAIVLIQAQRQYCWSLRYNFELCEGFIMVGLNFNTDDAFKNCVRRLLDEIAIESGLRAAEQGLLKEAFADSAFQETPDLFLSIVDDWLEDLYASDRRTVKRAFKVIVQEGRKNEAAALAVESFIDYARTEGFRKILSAEDVEVILKQAGVDIPVPGA